MADTFLMGRFTYNFKALIGTLNKCVFVGVITLSVLTKNKLKYNFLDTTIKTYRYLGTRL